MYSGSWSMNVEVDVIVHFSYMNDKVHFSLKMTVLEEHEAFSLALCYDYCLHCSL